MTTSAPSVSAPPTWSPSSAAAGISSARSRSCSHLDGVQRLGGRRARSSIPIPFILLNLVLSCLAAIQAPIIMMSQKRQEAKDRLRSENDYRVNLKAELEIRHLHDKIDHLITRQWERLAEIQQIQLEIMQDLALGRRR